MLPASLQQVLPWAKKRHPYSVRAFFSSILVLCFIASLSLMVRVYGPDRSRPGLLDYGSHLRCDADAFLSFDKDKEVRLVIDTSQASLTLNKNSVDSSMLQLINALLFATIVRMKKLACFPIYNSTIADYHM